MAGEIIEFRLHHELKRGRLHHRQAVLHSLAGQARLDQQIARISGLLGELEELTRSTGALPPPILVRARASIAETSRILPPCKRSAASTGPEENSDADPQPDIDRGLLERMYRAFDTSFDGPLDGPLNGPLNGHAFGDRGSADGGVPDLIA
jgi:hypothetical protein